MTALSGFFPAIAAVPNLDGALRTASSPCATGEFAAHWSPPSRRRISAGSWLGGFFALVVYVGRGGGVPAQRSFAPPPGVGAGAGGGLPQSSLATRYPGFGSVGMLGKRNCCVAPAASACE